MISIRSFEEKGSILRILTEGTSTGLGELSGQSVLSGRSKRHKSEHVQIKLHELHPLSAYLLIIFEYLFLKSFFFTEVQLFYNVMFFPSGATGNAGDVRDIG